MSTSTKLKYAGIDNTIIAYAIKVASEIDSRLKLHDLDFEDNVQQLVLYGLSVQASYKAGTTSFATYLHGKLQFKKMDILRSYSTSARRPFHPEHRKETDVHGEIESKEVIKAILDNPYIAEIAGVQMILELLTPQEREFVLALQEETVEAAGHRVGWKRSTTFNRLEEIRIKLKKVWTDFIAPTE